MPKSTSPGMQSLSSAVREPGALPPSSHARPVDSFDQAADLENELRKSVKGEIGFDRGSRALYSSDASNYRQIPIGLVIPRDDQDVAATVAACRKYGAPVLPRGAGTSLAGQCCNVAVILDFTKYMNRILEIEPGARFARVQPGVVLDRLRENAELHHLTFGPDPSTHSRCTLGGMIGNNSCGTHSLLAGKTVENVEELRVLLYDGTQLIVGATSASELDAIIASGGRRGEIYSKLRTIRDRYSDLIRARYPQIPRRVSGYNLDQLLPENHFNVARALVGTEGTCVTVLEAKLRLIQSPQHRTLLGLGYPDIFIAAEQVPQILPFGPIGLEGFEGSIIDGLRKKGTANLELIPEGRGILLVEFGSDDPRETEALALNLSDRLKQSAVTPDVRLYSTAEAKWVWKIRESGARSAAAAPGAPPEWEGWDDAAVAPEQVAAYLRDIRRLLDEYQYHAAFYGHFGHGCIHMRVSFDLESERGIRNYAQFVERAADLVVHYGGSLSGEHGDGQSRAALLPKMFGPELVKAFGEFKTIWDPGNKMNPHKVVDPYLPTENLRLGADYKPLQVATHFQFPNDAGSFAKAAVRCVGLGDCRKTAGGAMCPSYMVTLEEKHSTRGRAHMLFELLQGEVVRGVWKDDHVKEALDLCLSCKACKSECPTNVDIATYRAEFLSHYYEGKRRPLHAWLFGMIDRWAHLASFFPGIANFLTQAPGFNRLVHAFLHVPQARALPRFAGRTFQRSMREQTDALPVESTSTPASAEKSRSVILWPDTFTNYFHPEIGHAAVEVLQRAGLHVVVPQSHLCCGRPLYDFGMLSRAKAYLTRIMQTLGPEIDAGIPIVFLEPSCASVFRDELYGLFPNDARAARLRAQSFLFSEFLRRHADSYKPSSMHGKALLHGHCHHKALMGMADEEALLRSMGVELNSLDSGCCGMAGAFGFEKEKYEISKAIGERVLLPAVRASAPDTLIIADGFSCREQIAQNTGRRALHLAEVLQLAGKQSSSKRAD
jgi:FAD/FMN-containing dehydrogenase/Fe-S oxidoreductase